MNGFIKKKGKVYYAVINVKDSDGNWSKKWISTKTGDAREAKKVLKQLIVEMEKGLIKTTAKTNKMKFYELMDFWLENVIKTQIEETTYQGYCGNVRTHIIPYFKKKGIAVQDLTTMDIDRYISYEISRGRIDKSGGLSANSIKKFYHNMRKALDYAVDSLGIIENNPAMKVKLPKIKKYIPTYYAVDQLEQLLDITKGTMIETTVFLAVHYGLRRGEVLGLRWKDISFYNKTLTIRNTRVRTTKLVEKAPKSTASIRTLPLIENVEVYLNNLKETQLKEKKFLGRAYDQNDYVCKYSDGRPINLQSMDHVFRRLLKKHNMPHIRFHDIRHSAASYLLKLGISLKEISEWLGHADISTTVIYTHTDAEMKRHMADSINKLFNREKDKKK